MPVGETPGFVVVSPDGRRALVANQAAGVVTVVDTATNAVTARVPVPTGPPQYLAFSPDGRRVYVSIWDQARTVAAVGVLDTATNQFVATIPVRTRPYLSAVTPDGQRLYVPNHDSGTISVIDTGTNTVTVGDQGGAEPALGGDVRGRHAGPTPPTTSRTWSRSSTPRTTASWPRCRCRPARTAWPCTRPGRWWPT